MARFLYRLLAAFFIGIPATLLLLAIGVPVSGVALYAALFASVALTYVPDAIAAGFEWALA